MNSYEIVKLMYIYKDCEKVILRCWENGISYKNCFEVLKMVIPGLNDNVEKLIEYSGLIINELKKKMDCDYAVNLIGYIKNEMDNQEKAG